MRQGDDSLCELFDLATAPDTCSSNVVDETRAADIRRQVEQEFENKIKVIQNEAKHATEQVSKLKLELELANNKLAKLKKSSSSGFVTAGSMLPSTNGPSSQDDEGSLEPSRKRKKTRRFQVPRSAVAAAAAAAAGDDDEASASSSNSSDKEPCISLPGVPPELVVTIQNLRLKNGAKTVHFDDIVGMQRLIQNLHLTVIDRLKHPEAHQGLLKSNAMGVLLYGPPGTGKTMLASALANEVDAAFFEVGKSTLTSKWVGQSEKLVTTLFAVAKHFAPSVIFFDEIDSMMMERTSAADGHNRSLKTEFLAAMSRLEYEEADPSKFVLLIAATNTPDQLDSALLRRLPSRYHVPLPCGEARKVLLRKLFQKHNAPGERKVRLTRANVAQIVDDLEGYSCSDIRSMVTEAAVSALKRARDQGQTLPLPLNSFDLRKAMDTVKPSCSERQLRSLAQFDRAHGSATFSTTSTVQPRDDDDDFDDDPFLSQ
ncbi:MAG: hypothetical protein MHM6MM_002328 [Cercozoa sp. M6MM]